MQLGRTTYSAEAIQNCASSYQQSSSSSSGSNSGDGETELQSHGTVAGIVVGDLRRDAGKAKDWVFRSAVSGNKCL